MPVLEESREVLERYTRGDLDAFEVLFRQYQGKVFGWILQVVRDRGAAEDLTVETFWRVYRAHARFDPSRNFGGWVRRIAMNAALDHLNAVRPESELTFDLATPVCDPGISEEIRRKVSGAFGRLPPKLRTVAALALIEECSHQEIGEALGISVGAVKLRVYRAVRLLRKDLKRQGIEP